MPAIQAASCPTARLRTGGVYDAGIFKAVFMGGGPGSGKSTVADRLVGMFPSLRPYNSDVLFEWFLKQHNLSKDFCTHTPEQTALRDQLRERAKSLTTTRMDLWLQGRLGMLIDTTASWMDSMRYLTTQLHALGYEYYMVFVNTRLDVAQARNQSRERRVAPALVEQMWHEAQDNLGMLQRMFDNSANGGANHFRIVDNSERLGPVDPLPDDMRDAQKTLRQFMTAPVRSPAARQWIESELAAKDRSAPAGFSEHESFSRVGFSEHASAPRESRVGLLPDDGEP